MTFLDEKSRAAFRALLIGIYQTPEEKAVNESLLRELEELTVTMGVAVADKNLLHIRELHPRFLIGTGKAEEISKRVQEGKIGLIIFDHSLSPGQQRNWEKLTNVAVIDREEVILEIFGQRAQTKEARLQVDLARLEYSLPRLTRAWGHFGQQGGGIGGKGEGETQLELDRRMVRTQIERTKRELTEVKKYRATQRKDRQRTPVPNAAIVGYTNAGKSSLLHRLTGADVLIEDKLFATLDTTTRRIQLPNHQPLLLTDTVGFVRKLPHRLVEAFHATLEESILADYLIHVLDASEAEIFEQHRVTLQVLGELGASPERSIIVLNKIDLLPDRVELPSLLNHFSGAIPISVKTGEGIDRLLQALCERMSTEMVQLTLHIPHEKSSIVAALHREANFLHKNYGEKCVELVVELPKRRATAYDEYVVNGIVHGKEKRLRHSVKKITQP